MKHSIKIVLVFTCTALLAAGMAVPAGATPGAGTCEVVPAGYGVTLPDRKVYFETTAQCSGLFIDEIGAAVYQVNGTATTWKGSYTQALVNGEVSATTGLQAVTGTLPLCLPGTTRCLGGSTGISTERVT